MKKRYVIGVDIGTQGTKAAIFDQDGRLAGSGFKESRLIQPAPGITEEDPSEQVRSVYTAVAQAVHSSSLEPSEVAGIAIDGQMAGVIGIDRSGEAVTPYDSWLDTRCEPYIEQMKAAAGDLVTKRTGNAPSFNHGPKILWWKHEQPKTYRRIMTFVQPGGYAAMRMTGLSGEQSFIDDTYLHFTGFADNKNRCWDMELLELFNIDIDKMPHILAPTEQVGELTEESARSCGLKAGIPVIAGCGDTAASFIAAGAAEPGVGVDVSGTASVFAATTSSFVPDVEQKLLGIGRSVVPGLWNSYAYINGGGMNLEWFRALFKRPDGSKPGFDELNSLASRVSLDEQTVLFIPHLSGRVSPSQPAMRGAWIGLNRSHGIGHMYRAMLESVALEYALYLERLEQMNPGEGVRSVRNTGGGNSSPVWKQIKADVLGVEIVDVTDFVGATHGSAMVAAAGIGLTGNLAETAARWVKTGTIIKTDRKKQQFYKFRLEQYREALQSVERIMEKGKAP